MLLHADIDACRFTPEIVAGVCDPCVRTQSAGYGVPMSGALAFSAEMIRELLGRNVPVIGVSDVTSAGYYELCKRIGIIFCGKTSNSDLLRPFGHFDSCAVRYLSALLDHREAPVLALDVEQKRIYLPDGSCFQEGDIVTLDPGTGLIWRNKQNIVPPSDSLQLLAAAHKQYWEGQADNPLTALAFHAQFREDLDLLGEGVRGIMQQWLSDSRTKRLLPIGLWRTEMELRQKVAGLHPEVFDTILQSNQCPNCLEFLSSGVLLLPGEIHLRLADLHGFRDILPDKIQNELQLGHDHIPGTSSFNLRKELFRIQTRNALRTDAQQSTYQRLKRNKDKHIILPSVCSIEEIVALRGVVHEELRKFNLVESVGIGAMIETKEALENIEGISEICVWLNYGIGDLTAALTELPRSGEGGAQWMQKKGYSGSSPFLTLVPEVLGPMSTSIVKARRGNSQIKIGVCGHQVSGHDLNSILEVIRIGVDQVTIEPNPANIIRAMLAVTRSRLGNNVTSSTCFPVNNQRERYDMHYVI